MIQVTETQEEMLHRIANWPTLDSQQPPLPTTEEQLAVFSHLLFSPKEHLLINACAGSSKTTTMVEGVNRMVAAGVPPNSILCLAFNKDIATTLAERMPAGTTSRTLNALGHQALRQYFGSARIDTRKLNRLLAEVVPGYYDLNPAERRVLKRAVEMAKMNGVWPSPDDWKSGTELRSIKLPFPTLSKKYLNEIDSESFLHEHLRASEAPDLASLFSFLNMVLVLDIIQSFHEKVFSFIDQIYLPATVASISLPRYLNVFVDEAQDLSRIEQNLLEQVVSSVPKGRLVAVGDKAQAIYAFKGADPKSFERLGRVWQAKKLDLSISFRCSHAVVCEANQYDDRIRAWEGSAEGQVLHAPSGGWSFSDMPPDSAVLCRMNYPLVQAAVTCIQNNISVEFLGRDLSEQLQDFLQIHSKNIKSLSGLWAAINAQINQREHDKQYREADRLRDQMLCLQAIFSHYGVEELRDGERALIKFFSMEGNIKLATIHKAKGLEWPHVYLLRPDLCPSERAVGDPDAMQQEYNMLYVAITRAKISFTYLH